MSANKRSDSKTKIPEDECVDSGFISGPLDTWPGDAEDKPEPTEESRKVQNIVECDSGVLSGEMDSGICTLSSQFSGVHLIDTIPDTSSSHQTALIDPFRCTVTSPQEKPNIPLEHLTIFFQPDEDGDTQLHIAAIRGCQKSVATLIKICPNKELLDITNDKGYSPLHLAVMSGHDVVTRMLVLAGLSIAVRDRMGETPIHKATIAGNEQCLNALLTPVEEHPPRNLVPVLSQKNYNGQACVHLAASAGDWKTLHTLLYHGADVDVKENLAGWTALHIAARRGDARLVQLLQARGAGATLAARDYAGRTPRRLARDTPAARLFADLADSDDEYDSDDDYESDSESQFELISASMSRLSSNRVSVA